MSENLKSVVTDLVETGLSEKRIADEIGCDQSTINRIKTGKIAKTSYDIGTALHSLHNRLCQSE